MPQKPVQFVYVTTKPDGKLDWQALTEPLLDKPDVPKVFGHLAGSPIHGQLRVENELQVTLLFTADEVTHKRVDELTKDLVALAREWEIPLPYVFALTGGDALAHLVERSGDPRVTLCGQEVRQITAVSQAERCPACARLVASDD